MVTRASSDERPLAYGGPVHRGQFLMGPDGVVAPHVPQGWTTHQVARATVLHRAPDLPLRQLRDADGARWLLLGRAVTTAAADRSVADELASTAADDVPALTRQWAGRWLLIGPSTVVSDAGALLGCYCTAVDGGAVVLSSSVALLGAVTGARPSAMQTPRLRPTYANAHIPPSTGLPGARKQLPGQLLEWRTGQVRPGPGIRPVVAEMSTVDRIGRFGDLLQRAVTRLAAVDGTAHVALTAGTDSRLTLAAALDAGVDVEAVTLLYPEISRADRELPPQLAQMAGVPHRTVDRVHPAQPSLRAAWDDHTGLASQELDRDFYARGQFRFLADGDVLLRSGCMEVSSTSHITRFPHADPTSHPPSAEEIADGLGAAPTPLVLEQLAEWSRWVADSADARPTDWRVRLYSETRIGGWLSCVEQGLDLVPGTALHPANCAALHAEGLALPLDVRLSSAHQHELVARWAPDLADVPYNPPDGLASLLRRRVQFIARRTLATAGRS